MRTSGVEMGTLKAPHATAVHRRQVLRAMGMAGATAPLVPLLERTAQAATAPKRLLLLFSIEHSQFHEV